MLDALNLKGVNDYQSAIGKPLIHGLESLGIPKNQLEEAVRLFREYYAETGIFEAHIYPGIRELLLDLQGRGIPMHIVTAKPTLYAQKVVNHFELDSFFHSVNGLAMDSKAVSKVEQMEDLFRETGIAPHSFCFIGDRRQDILAGIKNGTRTIGVVYGYGDEDELEQAGAEFIVHDVPALSSLLR